MNILIKDWEALIIELFSDFWKKNVKNFKNLVDKVKLSVIVYLSCRKTEKNKNLEN